MENPESWSPYIASPSKGTIGSGGIRVEGSSYVLIFNSRALKQRERDNGRRSREAKKVQICLCISAHVLQEFWTRANIGKDIELKRRGERKSRNADRFIKPTPVGGPMWLGVEFPDGRI
ncbi:hypothetical protein CEXT_277131 [Caerostris extrusa]|uniref:Uncharacterized protein n=1 Tax=Caerostris extrusa TaxID=172846 RepID=A0AAV4MNZ0_CAEEX|nr:hypothetical protein CEXT_277131 [Caerostris extrusa]